MLQHHRLCSTAPEATVSLSEWTPIYRLRTNIGQFGKMDIFTSDDTRDTAFRADPPYRTRPLGSFNPRHQWNCFPIRQQKPATNRICFNTNSDEPHLQFKWECETSQLADGSTTDKQHRLRCVCNSICNRILLQSVHRWKRFNF